MLAIQTDVVDIVPAKDARLRAAKNLPVLATLLAARRELATDYLITGDKDLLALTAHCPIVSSAAFRAAHGA